MIVAPAAGAAWQFASGDDRYGSLTTTTWRYVDWYAY
jgi:hypothetical protein